MAAMYRRPDARRPLRPWLARVLRNQAALLARGERRRHAREQVAARAEALPSSAELAERAELQRKLVEAVLELRDPYRAVLLLRYYEGLSPEEIAARLVVNASTVRNQLARALVLLREELERRSGGDARALYLALVPLAVEPEASAAAGGVFATIAASLLAMQLVTKFALAVLVLAVVIGLSYVGCDRALPPRETAAVEPANAAAGSGAPSIAAVVPATTERDSARDSVLEPVDVTLTPIPISADAAVRGMLRERSTHLPIGDFQLEISDENNVSIITPTRPDGSFETSNEFAAGKLSIKMIDREDTQSLTFYDGGLSRAFPTKVEQVDWIPGQKLELEADLGPTLNVSIGSRTSLPEMNWICCVYDQSPCARNTFVACERAPLRTGSRTWIRCAAQALDPAAARGDLVLVATSQNGLFTGSAHTPGYGDVAVDVAPAAVLIIELSSESDKPIHEPQIELRSAESGCIRRADSAWNGSTGLARAESRQFFVFGGLEPGDYTIRASARSCAPAMLRAHAEAGRRSRIPIVLQDARGTSYLRGELRSASTRYDTPVTVRVVSTEQGDDVLTQRCEFEDVGGGMVAHFAFEGLAAEPYLIQVIAAGAMHYRWTPTFCRRTAPADDVVLVCEDLEPVTTVRVRALDLENDDPLDDATWEYTLDGVDLTAKGKELVLEGVSRESRLEWNVTARGFGYTSGNWKQFWHGARESFAEARLKRGWGAKVRVVSESTRIPLEGVELWVDRDLAGRTDERGVVLVNRSAMPRGMWARLDGWELVDDKHKLGVVVDDGARTVLVLPMRNVQ
jgi:RNA polymerase sigma factor (sigma-70 family)